ncbi:MAG: hypothetical protein E7396_03275 [Ruminococcaceae bacterium]|nr:hypothetical protein [Oscillospiraceae bacterium]
MKSKWGNFEADREALHMQYISLYCNDEKREKIEPLKASVAKIAEENKNLSHPVVKAMCFDYLTKNGEIYINSDDWFGICLHAQKIMFERDAGCAYEKAISTVISKWMGELDDKIHRIEDKHFEKYARKVLFDEFYIDYNHSTPNWDDIFALGIEGLLKRAIEYKEKLSREDYLTDDQKGFFQGIEITLNAVLEYFDRCAEVLSTYKEEKMVCMREAIVNLRHNPPSNIYEALLFSWIYWNLEEFVDSFRVRSMGAMDVLYYDFYKNDIAKGTFTKENIKELLVYYMNEFNAVRSMYQQPMYIGGIDKDGNCVVNELSYLFLDAYNTLSRPNPKLQAKINENTPDEFLKKVCETIRNGNSSISIINDDNTYKAFRRLGVAEEDAKTTLMSGCWDCSVKDKEVKTIPIRENLPKIIELTLTKGVCLNSGEQLGIDVGDNFETYEEFYDAFKKEWLYIWQKGKRIIENWELYLDKISPSNLYSSTYTRSLSLGIDGYSKGMKYNSTVFSAAGIATTVDSLCAIKKFVYDKKLLTLSEMLDAIKNNWSGYENIRTIIWNDKDKYGNGSSLANEITKSLVDFMADEVNGAPNSRGGYWKFGLISIDKNVRMGSVTKATPDGRYEGTPLSKNLSSVVGKDKGGTTELMNSVLCMDFTKMPHAGMLDMVLHPSAVSGEEGLEAFKGIIRAYFKRGGHSIQFNIFSSETLRLAQKYPEQYKNLQVRVCGWNVYFVELEKVLQDAFIEQSEHYEGL